MFRHVLIAIVVLAAALIPIAGWSADMEGKIQSVNAGDRTITLENGTTIWLADTIQGAEVKVMYEEKDGERRAALIYGAARRSLPASDNRGSSGNRAEKAATAADRMNLTRVMPAKGGQRGVCIPQDPSLRLATRHPRPRA